VPAQFQQGNSEVRLERPDFTEDGALFTLIEELLGQEKQAVLVPGFAQAGTQPGRPASGIRNLPRVVAIGGGMIIEGGGQLVGGIGVSGAPGPDKDEVCANAGIAAIEDLLEF
jgi:hypothetical protein